MEDIGGKIIQIPEGTKILTEGESNIDMYKIIKGHAEVYMGYETERETLVSIIGPQDCFGQFGMLLERPALYTVIAYSDVVVLRIKKDELDDFIRDNHKTVMDIMKNMAETVVTMRSQVELLLDDIKTTAKLSERTAHEIRKTIGSSAVYRNSAMTGEFHTSDRIRNRSRR